ncbi:MAG TPA: hypothetical protein DCX03_00295 [Bacteroidales bacterium]|jgi:hypothetical protein|nr:hypothetical protein [Bacteroidales bacterium]
MSLDVWSHYAFWKQRLMNDLNEGYFSKKEWLEFIASATDAGMISMADDMQKRLEEYTKGEQND